MNKKGINLLNNILLILTLLSSILVSKTIFLDRTKLLEVNLGLFIYPITFLIIVLINNKFTFKEAHKSIWYTILSFMLFYLILTIINNIVPNYNGVESDILLKNLFTPNKTTILNKLLYYPDLLHITSYLIFFYLSHVIICILYNAIEPYTNKFITYALSMFIPFTIDIICSVTLINVIKKIEFNKLIINLTSNFLIVIISTLLLSIIFSIVYKKSKN